MDIESELKQLGLHSSEVRVYIYLLENGLSTPPQIAKGTGIARTNCYHVLRELEERGLIQTQTSGKRKAYVARDPDSLLIGLSQKQEVAKRVVPELRELYTTQKNKPKIRFFSGWEEVQEIYKQTLEAEKIVAIASAEQWYGVDRPFVEWYVRQLAERKIIFNDLLTAEAQGHTAEEIKKVRGALHSIKFLPRQSMDLPTDILIWNDNIALVTFEKPIFGTIITSRTLAQTFKTIFGILWEKL